MNYDDLVRRLRNIPALSLDIWDLLGAEARAVVEKELDAVALAAADAIQELREDAWRLDWMDILNKDGGTLSWNGIKIREAIDGTMNPPPIDEAMQHERQG